MYVFCIVYRMIEQKAGKHKKGVWLTMNIKSVIKKNLNCNNRINSDDLYKKMQGYDYISFDIFDTLIKRNVAKPTDIFSVMELSLGKGFKAKRIEAEKRARTELKKAEITIQDIYSFFPESKREKLIEQELSIELKAIVPNQPVAEVYKRCVKDGKHIYIISDMYWPEDVVKDLLEKNGFTGYKNLYLSSTKQKVKSNGMLFRDLMECEGVTPEKLIHIGDSRKSDYIEPKKLGISAVKIPHSFKNIEFHGDEKNNTIELNYLNHFINNTFHYSENLYYQFGYSQFGKLLYGYVRWIHDEAVKRGIKKLFFFARDGYIIKQAYEAYATDKDMEIRYLEVSRRSLRVPILWMDCSFETIINMVVNAKLVSLESVFDGLGLEINDYIEDIEKIGLKRETIFYRNEIKKDKRLRILLENLKEDIIENSKREYKNLKAYLAQEKVTGEFGVIDIGYAGSMQRYLQQALTALSIDHKITGFYFGVTESYKKNILSGVTLDMNGYLFDFKNNPNDRDVRSSFVGLFETLFFEGGGTVRCFIEKDGIIKAERYPYEYVKNGELTEDYLKVKTIQTGALDFVRRAAMDSVLSSLCLPACQLFGGLYETGTNPNKTDIALFADIDFFDEGITEKLAKPKRLLYYLMYPKKLKNDFLRCRWKTGFLKRLLVMPLPYQKMYQSLKILK